MTCSVLENYHSNFAAGRRFASPRRRNMEPLPTHVTMSFKKMPFFQIRTIHRENLQGFISQQQSANPPYPTHDSRSCLRNVGTRIFPCSYFPRGDRHEMGKTNFEIPFFFFLHGPFFTVTYNAICTVNTCFCSFTCLCFLLGVRAK